MGSIAFGLPLIDEAAPPAYAAASANRVAVSLRINGSDHRVTIDPPVTLLDLLRETLGLTGTKKGCDHGQCGACTVLVNGRRINSCLSLAVSHGGDQVTTIEGLAHEGQLEPIEAALSNTMVFSAAIARPAKSVPRWRCYPKSVKGDASFVTPNLNRLAAVELTDDEIRERMSGNLCRCGAYPGIVAAVKMASGVTGSARVRSSGPCRRRSPCRASSPARTPSCARHRSGAAPDHCARAPNCRG